MRQGGIVRFPGGNVRLYRWKALDLFCGGLAVEERLPILLRYCVGDLTLHHSPV